MGKRYYCDFCDKAFPDNTASKRNHFRGGIHQQMKKAHYDAFRDPAAILASETARNPCRKFLQTGYCDYGDGCRFSHMTEDRRRELEEQCRQSREKSQKSSSSTDASSAVGNLDDWLDRREKRREKEEGSQEGSGGRRIKRRKTTAQLPEYQLPHHLACLPNLPPSLLPPTREDFVNLPLLEWG